jgi:Zn-dependent peptidase ImmA (M78 family)
MENTLLSDPEQSGSLFVDGPNEFTIIVPSHTSLLRDRFTVAHELGHYYVHYVYPKHIGKLEADRVMALRKGSNRIEWEANWFAAAFLMPAAAFRASHTALGKDVARIAKQYNVSQRAVEIRVQDLGLI